jgi:putative DNA methylase
LIEVALPLEAINIQSAREKSIRYGHPSTLHLWWARRPLATARAVLFAQLVDDPSVRFDEYRAEAARRGDVEPTSYAERAVAAERQRLFRIIENIVDWDNLGREDYWEEARAEILKSTGGSPPEILDPFAGGGTIPLEAQRLGLKAHASDLNPVAVLINKALIEIPPSFAGREPVFPGASIQRNTWPNATGLAEDVRRYGQWMRDEAERRIGNLYPKAKLPGGGEATAIAWVWARTVTCPNPACAIEMPLVRSWWLGKKKGKEAYVVPRVVNGRVEYRVGHDTKSAPKTNDDGTVGRTGAMCISCGTAVPLEYIREQSRTVGLGTQLLATVAEGNRSRVYVDPDEEHRSAAALSRPSDLPVGELPDKALGFRVQAYGMSEWVDLFTNRQLAALGTLSDLVGEARNRVLADAQVAGLVEGARLEQGGSDAAAYADAVATYLGMGVSRTTDLNNSIVTWSNSRDQARNLFARQAIPMAWDFVEVSPFADAAGDLKIATGSMAQAIDRLPATRRSPGDATQVDAASRGYHDLLISTDPPYYDNIGYSDLSDFFYVWLRRSLRDIHPALLGTMLVPKAEELVANPYRHGGSDGARAFFETGFEHVFEHAREQASDDYPIAVYYAFKQSESETDGSGGEASTGWETILGSMIHAGWQVTATWPVRSERGGRMISIGTNALASSIVLALRPRSEDAPVMDRKSFLAELREYLGTSLREMLQGTVAPVDLAQAAIGPGMAVFSKYAKVIEPSGETMGVHDALVQINAILDEVVRDQEGDFDTDSRFCVSWFEQFGFDPGPYGTAQTLATAKAASVDAIVRGGTIRAGGGKVRLIAPDELPDGYDPTKDDRISLWEVVMHAARSLSTVGLDDTGRIIAAAQERGVDLTAAKELAVRLYQVSNQRGGMTKVAGQFNLLGASWSDVIDAARAHKDKMEAEAIKTKTAAFDFETLGETDG